jgi:L-cystine transport system permease protein
MFSLSHFLHAFSPLLSKLPVTLEILAGALFFGVILAFIIAWVRLNKIPVLNQVAVVYVSFIRGTPTLVQLFLVYYALPELLRPIGLDLSRTPVMVFVILTYALQLGGFTSEVIRSAVNSIDKGQGEAARSVGMTSFQAFRRIVLPQALVIALPNFGNTVVSSLKETSLAFSVGIVDMMGELNLIATRTYRMLELYVAVALIYYVLCFLMERVFSRVERMLQRRGHRSSAQKT